MNDDNNSPIPTPLTDAAEHIMLGFVPADFARTLERANAALAEAIRPRRSLEDYDDVATIKRVFAECAALRAEVERLKSCGMTELAAINPNAADYCRHWEQRAERAEAAYEELKSELRWEPNEKLQLAADCLANLAKLLTCDDGVDPEAYWIELTPEQANLIKLVARQQGTPLVDVVPSSQPFPYIASIAVEYCEHNVPKGYLCQKCDYAARATEKEQTK